MMNNQQQTTELKQIGHYDILRCIGRGGMGLVYLARDTRLNRQVAIKCLRSELCEPHYRERFKREALLLAKLNHPHIVQIYDFIETPEQLALVMEFVDGQNLHLHLREYIVPFSQRMQWLTQIAQGLAVAHDTGIIHRDLKAENILINKRGEAKISDLGIAKSQDFNATLTDHVAGSYSSMSPEQAMGEELDSRSDLFSFGIMAYQLLCNSHPFGETDNKLQLMQRIISHAPIPPTKHNPGLPQEISELLGQLLSKNPDNRPANTHWLAAQCEKLSQLLLATSFAPDNTQALPESAIQYPHHQKQLRQAINTTDSGIRSKQQNITQQHVTFASTNTKELSTAKQKFYAYIKTNSITVILGGLTMLLLAAMGIWQLQPAEPRYVAVLPPALNTTDMQESQQELVKGAVYDAIQQSLLQLDGYYLIPQNEIADINASNTKEGLETIRRATAADDLITTNIQCKIEACTITLSRLTPDSKKPESRLRVQDTKTVDVLTDNYLSVATIVQTNVGRLYSEKVNNIFEKIDEAEYKKFLDVNHQYRDKGANQKLLSTLDELRVHTKKLPAVQTLYSEIALDLHYETNNPGVLTELEKLIEITPEKAASIIYYYNLFYLQIAQGKYSDADNTVETIKKFNSSASAINELHAYAMMSKKDYASAINFYKKAILTKKTASNMYYISLAYWHGSNNALAKQYLEESLKASPNLYKSQNLLGLISLVEGDIKTAMLSFEKLIEFQPNDILSLNNLGFCYLLIKQHTKSIELFSLASNLAPLKTTYMLNKADANDLAGNTNQAQIIYNEIISRLNSKEANSENLIHLSQANAHLGRYTTALNYLQQLEKIDSQSYKTTYTAALVHTLAKNNASAILNIEASLKKGMNAIWFSFSWFDQLCEDKNFNLLMQNFGEPDRCTLQNI
jgi:serine/threonine protein kinase/Tfp pilus assembly protein PilF